VPVVGLGRRPSAPVSVVGVAVVGIVQEFP
jgi:hypothetical protein